MKTPAAGKLKDFPGDDAASCCYFLVDCLKIGDMNHSQRCWCWVLGIHTAKGATICGVGEIVTVHGVVPAKYVAEENASFVQLRNALGWKLHIIYLVGGGIIIPQYYQ